MSRLKLSPAAQRMATRSKIFSEYALCSAYHLGAMSSATRVSIKSSKGGVGSDGNNHMIGFALYVHEPISVLKAAKVTGMARDTARNKLEAWVKDGAVVKVGQKFHINFDYLEKMAADPSAVKHMDGIEAAICLAADRFRALRQS